MKLNSIILLINLLFCGYFSFGQCPGNPPLAVTFESTESRCESNGTITLHIIGGNPFTDTNGNPIYNNTIIAPVTLPIGGQADSVFSALEADTYTVEVADANGCTVTQQITVPGNHMQLELTPTWGKATCDGSGGGWICGTPEKGRPWPPGYYRYDLLQNGVVIKPLQLDSCFTDLAAGMYRIRAWDSCNNFQTRDVTITTKTYWPLVATKQSTFLPCDSMCFSIYFSHLNTFGEFPYAWEIIASDEPEILGESGVFTPLGPRDTLCYSPLFQSGGFILKVTDACGNTGTTRVGFRQNIIVGDAGFDCQSQSYYVSASSTLSDCTGSSFEIYSAPTGVPLPPPQDSGFFPVPISGTYCIRVTDCCGYISTKCLTANPENWSLYQCDAVIGCTRGWTGFKPCIQSYGAVQGIKFVIASAPIGYPNSLPDTLQNGTIWREGPIGNYCIQAYDLCGRRDTACFTYTDTLVFERNIAIVPNCVTGNEITLSMNKNIAIRSRLYDINGTATQIGNTLSYPKVLTNFPNGVYYYVYSNLNAGNCELGRDTFTVSDYIQPSISSVWGIDCDSSGGLISVQSEGGTLPYTYELYQGPVTRPLQSSPVFSGLPVGVYDVRLYDDCLNSSITTVSIEPFVPVINGEDGAFCIGDTASLSVDYINVASYSWMGPNGNTSDTSTMFIPNLASADSGTYVLDINISNPDQTSCVAQSVVFDLEVSDCTEVCPDLSPITTILPGNIAGVTAVGVAVEITELGGMDTDGSGIFVRIPSDPRLSFIWDLTLTFVAFTPVNNADWNYLGDNGIFHNWTYNGPGLIINANTKTAFGFLAFYDPQSTDGQTTITATIVPFGGGECIILNNTDSEQLVYFN